jgi:hypothetical protein
VAPSDWFSLAGLYSAKPSWRQVSSLLGVPAYPRTASSCPVPTAWAGCVPSGAGYGVAVTGPKGAAALPAVRLAVSTPWEPNVPLGKRPAPLSGSVTVSGLAAGRRYRLLRFNAAAAVPAGGGAAALLAAAADASVDFVAAGATWAYDDPKPIMSHGVAFYRCAPL